MNIQGWFPLGLTGSISFQFKGLSRVLHIWGSCYFSWQTWFPLELHPVQRCVMYSAWKLNNWGGSAQPCHTPFSVLNKSVFPCPVQTVASWPTFRAPRRKVRSSGSPISLRIFQFVVIHTVKGFSVVNEVEVDVFLEFSCFLYDLMNVGNLISHSSAFSKSSLYILNFLVYILKKHRLKDFYLDTMWNEWNCMGGWTFFGIVLWNWNESWPFLVLWLLLSFPNVLTYWVQHLNSIIF